MLVLGAVVYAGAGLDEHMPDNRQLRDLGLGDQVAARLVFDDLAGILRASGEHALEEAFRGRLVAALLQKDVEFGAMLIEGAPQQIRLRRAASRRSRAALAPYATLVPNLSRERRILS